MARSLRIEYAGAIYHVMARGNQGQKIYADDGDRKLWLSTLGQAWRRTGWRIHAFVLMGNHYHLLRMVCGRRRVWEGLAGASQGSVIGQAARVPRGRSQDGARSGASPAHGAGWDGFAGAGAAGFGANAQRANR
ncbi:hypothetical protein SBV1_2790010 [Verrucomicrobia bacterium]|nr:hypothetical protein SBV1_2790010 [Verrucomicrobiota bacterium]